MSTVNQLINKYAQPVAPKQKSEVNPHRVQVGSMFMQPTGGKAGKPYNFSYAYYGVYAKDGSFIGGFSMSNAAMLAMVEAGALGKGFLALFEAYAEKHAATETVIKLQA